MASEYSFKSLTIVGDMNIFELEANFVGKFTIFESGPGNLHA